MNVGVRGESDLRGGYCVSVDCRVGHFRSLPAMTGGRVVLKVSNR
jgi:hypothetical protein